MKKLTFFLQAINQTTICQAVSRNMQHFFNSYNDTLQKFDLFGVLFQIAQADYTTLHERIRATDFGNKY